MGRHVCGPENPYDPDARVKIDHISISISGWPSRGGVIVLDDPQHIDFDFLGLDPLDPPEHRDQDQEAEDAFCQRLLLLGAKWWDSEERYFYVKGIEQAAYGYVDSSGHGDGSFQDVNRPGPTMREKRWVRVGWPSTGGLWVSEFESHWGGVDEDNLPPEGMAGINLARSMDERCRILRDRFRGKFYESVNDYKGYAFLTAWQWKWTGEVSKNLLTPQETTREWIESPWAGRKTREEMEEDEDLVSKEAESLAGEGSSGTLQRHMGDGIKAQVARWFQFLY
jgi:hypothetical protein